VVKLENNYKKQKHHGWKEKRFKETAQRKATAFISIYTR